VTAPTGGSPLAHLLHPVIALVGAPGAGASVLAQALQSSGATKSVTVTHNEALEKAFIEMHVQASAPCIAEHRSHNATSTDFRRALQSHRNAALTLVMGLDQPAPLQDRATQEACDALIRQALNSAGVAFTVVYGQGGQRLRNALIAIESIASTADRKSASDHSGLENTARKPARRRTWDCEKCSDPECEHRLFTTLIAGRDPQPSAATTDKR
jgi:hypothetical protein